MTKHMTEPPIIRYLDTPSGECGAVDNPHVANVTKNDDGSQTWTCRKCEQEIYKGDAPESGGETFDWSKYKTEAT